MVPELVFLGNVVGETVTKVQQLDGTAGLFAELLANEEPVFNETEL